ncbi:MAG TPA: hypothetical protein VJB13_00850 [Candidatus Nanoarchaeia archaeon]|nr:hypothetical protein [Candidatus Nanoarchaeia archaeon]
MPKKRSKKTQVERELNEIRRTESKLLQQEQRIEKKENKILAEEQKIEKVLFRIGNFEFKRKHLLELIKGVAGAFLGVGLGRSILNLDSLAEKLQWWNIIGILIFIIGISWLLIYKNEKQYIQKHGLRLVWKKLVFLYVISVVIEFIALWLFASLPADTGTLVKILVIGSYAAMAGAVSFSLI